MKIYFITFGSTHNYASSLSRIKLMAEQSGFFDFIFIYTEKDFDVKFIEQYGNFMINNIGFGFWIWKSYFVKKTFDQMQDGDILVYADAGCSIVKNSESEKKFKVLINLVKSHESGSLGFQMDIPEELYTKSNIFTELNALDYTYTGQVIATIFFLRKCERSEKLIEEFYINSQKIELINNDFNKELESKNFIAPRNDQSIFSILRKKHCSLLIPDSTWFTNFYTQNALSNPILATRIRIK